MDAYTGFAQVYDLFMDNVPYDEWCAYICETLKKHGIADGPVLDLGCGTGKMTRLLKERGYDMIGVDLSEEMLSIAREQGGEGILYLQQDMRELVAVKGSVDHLRGLTDNQRNKEQAR